MTTWTPSSPTSLNWTTDTPTGSWSEETFLEYLLQQNGDNILDEDGNLLMLESAVNSAWIEQTPHSTNWS